MSAKQPQVTAETVLEAVEESSRELEDLRFECQQLRNEVLQNDNQALQIMGAMVLLTTTLMSLALSQVTEVLAKAILFILVEAIAFIALHLNTSRVRNTCRIASYIKLFIEPRTRHVRWEKRLEEFRKTRNERERQSLLHIHIANDQQLIYTVIVIINSLFGSLYLYRALSKNQPSDWVFLVAPLILTFIIFLILNRQYEKGTNISEFDKIWKEVQTKEKSV